MYYIAPITENPYIKEQLKTILEDTSSNDTLPIEHPQKSKRHKACKNIEIFLFMLYLLDILTGFLVTQYDKIIHVYHFINENITPNIYLIALLVLSVYKQYPSLASIKTNFYFRIYSFFLIYTAFCNILTSYHINGYILFLITGFGLTILYLGYFIHTSGQALDSFLETTTKPTAHSKM